MSEEEKKKYKAISAGEDFNSRYEVVEVKEEPKELIKARKLFEAIINETISCPFCFKYKHKVVDEKTQLSFVCKTCGLVFIIKKEFD